MKAILWFDGDLDVIFESEEELNKLEQEAIKTNINWQDGKPVKTSLILNYSSHGKFHDVILIESDQPFTKNPLTEITLNQETYFRLKTKTLSERIVGTSRGHQHIQIYAPKEFTPLFESSGK